ncbi:MAG: cation:proton antiporter regulatory subunit [Acidimicrobiia bacterium]|jgi:TrkA domain protein|nr:cation:proton antiporter regulatory subunit [Acidimicrobiia bacterium]MBP8181945.1 cation:proton antiporter regulatory subunit [Acidimicrobiia bacterium]
MVDVRETPLPGVGVRYDFDTEDGDQLGVIVHRGGRRDVLIYSSDDPDACATTLRLSVGETRALAELLGATRVSEVAAAVQQDVEGLAIDWLHVLDGSAYVGRSIGEGQIRSRSGVSIVAVIRGTQTFAAPEPDFTFEAGDVAVAIGTAEGLATVQGLFGK